MAKEDVKQAISETIVSNGKRGITAESLSNVLNLMVDEGGSGGGGTMKLGMMSLITTGVVSSEDREQNKKIFDAVKNGVINNETTPSIAYDYGELLLAMEPEAAMMFEHMSLLMTFPMVGYISGPLLAQELGFTEIVIVSMSSPFSSGSSSDEPLMILPDGNVIESVLMKYHHGNSVCISSQVGCKMGCRFCASTIGGWTRNLTAGEMLDQIYRIQSMSGERVSNIVIMGTGEPMDNYDNVLRFLRMISDENGLNISQRNITVSTCGIVPKMRALAEEKLQITLALSLHASTDEKRQELMPIAKVYSMEEVLDACKYYYEQTGRRLTFEYSLVGGKNDTEEDARLLSEKIKGLNCHVNLIPVNPIKERDYRQSEGKVIQKFKNKLENYGINVTIRREMGRDIDGACGQLRKSYQDRSTNLG
jgi:23S rRNA (adenine2503-C2)-methyltransferase